MSEARSFLPARLPLEPGPAWSGGRGWGWGVSCALRSSTLPLLPTGKEQTPRGDKAAGVFSASSQPQSHPAWAGPSHPGPLCEAATPPPHRPTVSHSLPDPPSLFVATRTTSAGPPGRQGGRHHAHLAARDPHCEGRMGTASGIRRAWAGVLAPRCLSSSICRVGLLTSPDRREGCEVFARCFPGAGPGTR